jgi:hypothetical protein
MPAVATKLLFLLYFSQHVSAPQVQYNINCLSKVPSVLQLIRCFVLSAHAVRTALTLTVL